MNKPTITSILEVFDIQSNARSVLKVFENMHMEAPNWTPDGKALIYNSGGSLFRFDLITGESSRIETGRCISCNNDHLISSDGKHLAISSGTADGQMSRIWVLPIEGGEPEAVVDKDLSFLHGWSPDKKTVAYTRLEITIENGNWNVLSADIYSRDIRNDSEEVRLTDGIGNKDGSEYSPDGKTIWYNSTESGLMQIWKMNADGSDQTQVTFDEERNSWFPHISPDGKKIVYIAYKKGDVAPHEHPPNKNVELRIMDADGSNHRTLCELLGGQGTINVPSWAADSQKFAFVSYRNDD